MFLAVLARSKALSSSASTPIFGAPVALSLLSLVPPEAHPPACPPRPCSTMEQAFTDLNNLMGKASDMVQLAERFRAHINTRGPGGDGAGAAGRRAGRGGAGLFAGAGHALLRTAGCSLPEPPLLYLPGQGRAGQEACKCPPLPPPLCSPLPAGGEGGEGEELDAETALDLLSLGIVNPVTRESAGRQYEQQLARQVGGHCGGYCSWCCNG